MQVSSNDLVVGGKYRNSYEDYESKSPVWTLKSRGADHEGAYLVVTHKKSAGDHKIHLASDDEYGEPIFHSE